MFGCSFWVSSLGCVRFRVLGPVRNVSGFGLIRTMKLHISFQYKFYIVTVETASKNVH